MLEVEGDEAVEAMKVIKIIEGTEGYHVGLLPRYIIKEARRNNMKDAFGHVILPYKYTSVEVLRHKNNCNHCVVSLHLLQDIQVTE
jgi:hypothetical protein